MKNFTRRGYRIVDATWETKLLYSFFLVFTLIGLVTIAAYQCAIIGWNPAAIQGHYVGNEATMSFPKSFLQLLEITHAHAFIMGLVYLTLAHIVVATRLSDGMKRVLIIGGFIATTLDLLLPWGIRYGSVALAPLMPLAWVLEWVFYLSYILIPLYDMWIKPTDLEKETDT